MAFARPSSQTQGGISLGLRHYLPLSRRPHLAHARRSLSVLLAVRRRGNPGCARDSASRTRDESPLYTKVGKDFSSHETVNHSIEEYARTAEDGVRVTTNTAEGFFGNSKRSIDGTHHSISYKHTHLYFAELDHKYNTRKMTDGERTVVGILRMEGKRLMLHSPQRKAS